MPLNLLAAALTWRLVVALNTATRKKFQYLRKGCFTNTVIFYLHFLSCEPYVPAFYHNHGFAVRSTSGVVAKGEAP